MIFRLVRVCKSGLSGLVLYKGGRYNACGLPQPCDLLMTPAM